MYPNASMESIDVHSNQPNDENVAPLDVNSKYYCHGLVEPLEVNPFHVVFGVREVLVKQRKSFKFAL